MGTFDVVEAISKLPLLSYVGVVDLFDKMSFIATCILLVACSLIVTLREYVMDPISCYMSHNPGGENLLKFVENYCWVQGTMSINDHEVPQTEDEWRTFQNSRIIYYQWVPFMLLFQATLFHLPRILWSLFTFNMAGTNVGDIIVEAATITYTNFDEKVDNLANRIENMLVEHREYRQGKFQVFKRRIYEYVPLCIVSKRFANWLTCGYLFTKTLYLVNGIGQIYLMQAFLQLKTNREYSSNFGMEIATNIINGRNWDVTHVFPRVTYCMARVKQMASVNIVTAQCVLTANLFIEKIYIFLWFWIVIVSIFTAFSLFVWLIRFIVPSRFRHEIRKNLKLHGQSTYNDEDINAFSGEFLRLDGIFLLHMISINAGDLITSPLVTRLYNKYMNDYKDKSFTKKDTFLLLKSKNKAENMKTGSTECLQL